MNDRAGLVTLIINASITIVVVLAATALSLREVMPISTYVIIIIAATGINGGTTLIGSMSQNAKETITTVATETTPTQRRPQ